MLRSIFNDCAGVPVVPPETEVDTTGCGDIGIFHGVINGSIYDGETTGILRIQQLDLRKKPLKPE